MNEQQLKNILIGLKTAMRAEFEGYHFYMMAAENTEDARGKDAFKLLASDEFEHLNFLQAQYDNLVKNGQPDDALALKAVLPFDGPNPIFSAQIKTRIKDAHHEMTILAVGIQLELNAINEYNALASAANDPVVSGFYRELAAFENSHYQILLAQQDTLKEAYWTENHFQPF
ncbi:MAG: ferritin family protein [Deltaproteobacteria bacterium]|nr:ferritin family protein [Deltaproteobacteria bacterium]